MNDLARLRHIPRAELRRYLRTAWTGAVATVIAVGVLVMAASSVPASHVASGERDLPIRLYGLVENVSVGETETAPEGVTLGQIVAVLERAEREAREQGPNFSPTVAQAAAELGMLYTTYQMQQLAFGENNEGLRIEDAPVARGSEPDGGRTPDADQNGGEQDADQQDGAGQGDGNQNGGQNANDRNGGQQDDGAGANDGDTNNGDTNNGDTSDDDTEQPPSDEDDDTPAVQVSDEHTSEVGSHTEDAHGGYITYDQVVIAAIRLANMLDPSSPNALVEVDGVEERAGVSLRESLLDVVSMFGGSTLGYANGRIPAAVLCPLEFAPGHMLRCDAAERLTALSEEFEEEFGYPIPITDSYRSYELQVMVANTKPHLAAIPGTSNHGWGLAVDMDNPIAGGNSPEYVWLRLHGPDYGWDNPSWARLGGAKPEPWHFEFFAAGSIPNRAIDPSDVGMWSPDDSTTPRYKPALDPKPKNGDEKSDDDKRKPRTKPSDRPGDNPSSPRPSDPDPEPSVPEPSDPTPPKPTKPPTKPTTKPTPTPTPTPSTSPSPSPSPSPSTSEPAQSPSPSSSESADTDDPTPSPSPSVSPSPLATMPKEPAVVTEDTED